MEVTDRHQLPLDRAFSPFEVEEEMDNEIQKNILIVVSSIRRSRREIGRPTPGRREPEPSPPRAGITLPRGICSATKDAVQLAFLNLTGKIARPDA